LCFFFQTINVFFFFVCLFVFQKNPNLLQLFATIEMPIAQVVGQMQFHGIGFDLNICVVWRNKIEESLKHLESIVKSKVKAKAERLNWDL